VILPLVHYPDPVLRRKGLPVRTFDAKLAQLAQDMRETMEKHEGVGLAAQQIGEALQFAVVDIRDCERESGMTIAGQAVDPEEHMPLYLVNATVNGTKAKETGTEGCLSFPGLRCEVSRSRRVAVKTHGLDGQPFEFEATGLLAIAIQHEFDHLQGKLFIDSLPPKERDLIRGELAEFEAAYAAKRA